MKSYTINYGVVSDSENSVNVVCEESDIEKIAYAIYHGEITPISDIGVLTIECDGKQKVLIDRM